MMTRKLKAMEPKAPEKFESLAEQFWYEHRRQQWLILVLEETKATKTANERFEIWAEIDRCEKTKKTVCELIVAGQTELKA
jgi:hypothetical protein